MQQAQTKLTEPERIFKTRMENFLGLGFDELTAELLADSKVDWHEAEKLIRRDCPLHLCFEILI